MKTFEDALAHPDGQLTIPVSKRIKADGLVVFGQIDPKSLPPHWYLYGLRRKPAGFLITDTTNMAMTYLTPLQIPTGEHTQYHFDRYSRLQEKGVKTL